MSHNTKAQNIHSRLYYCLTHQSSSVQWVSDDIVSVTNGKFNGLLIHGNNNSMDNISRMSNWLSWTVFWCWIKALSKSHTNGTCAWYPYWMAKLLPVNIQYIYHAIKLLNMYVAPDNDSSKKAVMGWIVIAGFYVVSCFYANCILCGRFSFLCTFIILCVISCGSYCYKYLMSM